MIHVASEPLGDVQDCQRCGAVLVDNRGWPRISAVHRWFVTGDHIEKTAHSIDVTFRDPDCPDMAINGGVCV